MGLLDQHVYHGVYLYAIRELAGEKDITATTRLTDRVNRVRQDKMLDGFPDQADKIENGGNPHKGHEQERTFGDGFIDVIPSDENT